MGFGAEGLFGGLVGSGVAAIALWPFMALVFAGAAIIGGTAAWVVSWLANKMAVGIPAKIKGGAA
jgi:hypothetical protein